MEEKILQEQKKTNELLEKLISQNKDPNELLTAEQISNETGIAINKVRQLFNDPDLAVQSYTKPKLVTRKAWNEFVSVRRWKTWKKQNSLKKKKT